jgi:hypothetical protein
MPYGRVVLATTTESAAKNWFYTLAHLFFLWGEGSDSSIFRDTVATKSIASFGVLSFGFFYKVPMLKVFCAVSFFGRKE